MGHYNFYRDLRPGLRLTWNVGVLESADEVTGLYTIVTNAVSPTLASLTEAKKFYRTKIQ